MSLGTVYAFILLLFAGFGAYAVAPIAGFIHASAPALGYIALAAGAVAGASFGNELWKFVEPSRL